MSEGGGSGPRPAATAGIGAVLLLLAAIVLFDAWNLPVPAGTPGVGPSAAMKLVAVLVALLGVAHLVVAWRERAAVTGPVERGNHAALGWVLGALAGLMLILQFGGGFVVASTWLFALTARGFGAPLGAKSVGIGLVLSALVFLFFTKALSLGLPAGPLERLVL